MYFATKIPTYDMCGHALNCYLNILNKSATNCYVGSVCNFHITDFFKCAKNRQTFFLKQFISWFRIFKKKHHEFFQTSNDPVTIVVIFVNDPDPTRCPHRIPNGQIWQRPMWLFQILMLCQPCYSMCFPNVTWGPLVRFCGGKNSGGNQGPVLRLMPKVRNQ